MNLLNQALEYERNNNLSIIPIQKNKKPFFNWAEFQRRKATAEEIRQWLSKWPNAMIGIVTGQISGLSVIDCDTEQAFQSVQELLPDTLEIPTARTPKGWHLYFKYESGLNTKASAMPSVDIRSEGGYIIAPPSVNGNGKGYEWLKGLSLNECPAPPVPSAFLNALYNNINNYLYRGEVTEKNTDLKRLEVTSSDLAMFENGRRDNDLFHLAYILVKGGMPEEEITQTLERLIISWGENPDRKWIQTKIKSAFQQNQKKEINIAHEVRDFVVTSNGIFLTSDVINRLQVTSRQEKKNVVNTLLRLKKEGIIEKYGEKDGCYRTVNNEVEEVNFLNAPTEEFPISFPLGIDRYSILYPGNIVIIAGSKSAGKTAFLLNIVKENMQQHEIIYLNSEMGDTEFRKRLELFKMPLSDWRFKAIHRASNFADLITPEKKIFIVDFLEVTSDFWKVAQYIQEIHKKLKEGICIIALQKSHGKETGRGGDFSIEKARLYINLDYFTDRKINQMKITEAKAWRTEINPRGMYRDYKLANGSKFVAVSDWQG